MSAPDQPRSAPDDAHCGDPGQRFRGRIGKTLADSQPWWPPQPTAPDDAPNIVVILLDDMGFADLGPFGAEVDTPNIDRLAAQGARFTNYTTVPMCTPARAALLTGKNPHSVGCGWITHADPGYPGYGGQIAPDAPTMAELLQANGYSTMAIGKWHNTLEHNVSAAGDRSSWPVQRGFDRFYGFLASETSYFHPENLYEGSQVLDIEHYPPDYFATDDWTDRAIRWTKEHVASDPAKPFFLYLAYNAPHVPIQAKPADLLKYRGRYDAGWDVIRAQRFEAQVALGLFPKGTRLPDRNPGIPAWTDLSDDDRELYARHMEVYAALVDNLDQNVGRLVEHLQTLGLLSNTLILLASDNGANSLGGDQGSVNAWQKRLGGGEDKVKIRALLDQGGFGGPETYMAYPRGWAQVSNTPFRYFKRTPLNGGIRVPFIAHWPEGMAAARHDVTEWVHVTDVLPTVLELLGIRYPDHFRGYRTRTLDGLSFAGLLKGVEPPGPARNRQHYELDGNRGFIQDGWKIVSLQPPGQCIELDNWMLFDLKTDPTEIDDVASKQPDRLMAMVSEFERDAAANYVYPLDNRGYDKSMTLPPYRLREVNAVRHFFSGAQTAERVSVSPLFADRAFRVTARFHHSDGDAGVIYSVGGIFGGLLLYVLDGAAHFVYQRWPDPLELEPVSVHAGQIEITLDYRALGKRHGQGSLSIDGKPVAIDVTMSPTLGRLPSGGVDVGINRRQPVLARLARFGTFRYSGTIDWVRVEPGPQAPGTVINMIETDAQKRG